MSENLGSINIGFFTALSLIFIIYQMRAMDQMFLEILSSIYNYWLYLDYI